MIGQQQQWDGELNRGCFDLEGSWEGFYPVPYTTDDEKYWAFLKGLTPKRFRISINDRAGGG